MKKIVVVGCGIFALFGGFFSQVCFGQISTFWKENPIITTNPDQVLDSSRIGEDNKDPIRQGTLWPVQNPKNLDDKASGTLADGQNPIADHPGALSSAMNLIQTIINYLLGLLALIALVYLIYHGFLMVSASGDDKQFDKGKSGIKTAVIAIVGI
ncbi:MAG: hypothetical protein LBO09_06980 [Candidatus Peribacteria bacterium]|jgi:hypothetical protein|nr:hypothetical protein [Candidatus Peribacteria bacterium]